MGRKSEEVEEGELTDEIAWGLGKFPNGMPRVVDHGSFKDIDGIPHVYYDGGYHPVWSDERLVVDVRHKALWHEWMEPAWGFDPAAPLKPHNGSHYENTEVEAFDLAVSLQEDLMRNQEYVPIGIRW